MLLDLEDSVAEAAKPAAREMVVAHLRNGARRQPKWVRINSLNGQHALKDLAAVVPAQPDGIILPKATRPGADRLHHYLTALEAAADLPLGGIRVMVVATELRPPSSAWVTMLGRRFWPPLRIVGASPHARRRARSRRGLRR